MQRPARRGGVQRAERAAEADARRRQGHLEGLREPSWAWGETVGLVARRGTCQAGSAPAPHPLLHEALPWCPRLSLLGMRPTSPQGSCSSAGLDTKRVPLHPLACLFLRHRSPAPPSLCLCCVAASSGPGPPFLCQASHGTQVLPLTRVQALVLSLVGSVPAWIPAFSPTIAPS